MSVNSKMTAIADAIREKTGGTDLLTLDQMAAEIEGIQIGVELPPLDDAVRGTASDMAQGKQLYDENGNLVEGGLKVWTGIVTQNTLPSYDEASGKIILNANHTEKVIVDKGNMIMRSYASNFGNAKREDVVKGKFFTSEAGLMVEGTHVCAEGSTVKPVILEVEKITSNTYAGETSYSNEAFILLDIYPKSGGTVKVTYGGLTKTITDDGTSENPNAQQVRFGTFNGVSDSVETPASGTLTIDGDYAAFGVSKFVKDSKNNTIVWDGITEVVDFGTVEYIPDYAFGYNLSGSKKLKFINLPYNLKSIGTGAFNGCTALEYLAIPHGIVEISSSLVGLCTHIRDFIIPSSVTTIKNSAFFGSYLAFLTIPASVTFIGRMALGASYKLQYVTILATTPPTQEEDIFGNTIPASFKGFIVPFGCGEAYKAASGWSTYADYIIEAVEDAT